ncbi:MAG: HEAT repeat domain-containing protein [Candidatus Micrarchaeia archaeon]|jgi:HEAT repeat protein
MIDKEKIWNKVVRGETDEVVALGGEAVEPIIDGIKNCHTFSIGKAYIEILAEIAKSDENIFQRLINELESNEWVLGDWIVKEYCANALGLIKDPRAIDALITGLTCGSSVVRKACVIALGEIGDSRAVDIIIKKVNGMAPCINEEYAKILGLIQNPRAANILIEGLNNEKYDVRKACIEALAKIAQSDEKTFQRLIEELETNQNLNVKRGCAEALGMIRDPRAVEYLINGLKDLNFEFREACAIALGLIGNPRGLAFKKIICDKNEKDAIKIGIVKTLEIIKEYIELIKDYRPKERVTEIKIDLYSFFRKVFEKESNSRMRMDLPELKMKPPKRGPMLHAQLRVAT